MMNEDIDFYYDELQKYICNVEEDDNDQYSLDMVRNCFRAVYEYIKIFLIDKKEKYYGYFLMDMELNMNCFIDDEAAVNMDGIPFVLRVNPLLLGKRPIKEIIFIICHEIEHIVLEHPVQAKAINAENDPWKDVVLNYAMDASINDRLENELKKYKLGLMTLPEDAVTSKYLASEYKTKLEDMKDYLYYYDKILMFETRVVESAENGVNLPNADIFRKGGSGTADSLSSNDRSGGDSKGSNTSDMVTLSNDNSDPNADDFWADADSLLPVNKEKEKTERKREPRDLNIPILILPFNVHHYKPVTVKNRLPGLSLHRWTETDLPEDIQERIRQYIEEVKNTIPNQLRGMLSGSDLSKLERVTAKPQIKWEKVLRRYIGMIPNGHRKTRMRLNRRQPERYDLSGQKSNHKIDIVVAIDTSGSMTVQLLQMIFNEIFMILNTREYHLTIIECDNEVQKVYEAKSTRDISYEVKGRGGTAFSPVIEYVNADKNYRHSLLIYFTDGFGEREIPEPLVYRMLWVLPCSQEEVKDNLSVSKAYGDYLGMNLR